MFDTLRIPEYMMSSFNGAFQEEFKKIVDVAKSITNTNANIRACIDRDISIKTLTPNVNKNRSKKNHSKMYNSRLRAARHTDFTVISCKVDGAMNKFFDLFGGFPDIDMKTHPATRACVPGGMKSHASDSWLENYDTAYLHEMLKQ